MGRLLEYVRHNPVVVHDVVKYAVTLAVLFGLPVPPGVDVAIAGLFFALLSIYTRSKVSPVLPKHRG